MLKIAVPLANGMFSPHFGGAESLGLYLANEETRIVGAREVLPWPADQHGAPPAWMRDQGVCAVLAGRIGPSVRQTLDLQGIEVVQGVVGEDPKALVQAYLDGTLESAAENPRENND